MSVRLLVFFLIGTGAGALITVQSVLNAALGKRTGSLGSVLLLTLVSIALLIPLVLLIPGTADLRQLPGPSQWYVYAGGLLGIAILATPIVLMPRIGPTATFTALVAGGPPPGPGRGSPWALGGAPPGVTGPRQLRLWP